MTDSPNHTESDAADGWDAEFEALLQAAIAGELDASEGATGPINARLLRRTAGLVAVASGADDAPLPPASLRTGVLESIRSGTASRATAPIAIGPATTTADIERKRRWGGRRPFAAAAAAIAVAVAAFLTLAPGSGVSPAFATELIPAPDSPSPDATGRAELVRTKNGGWVMRLKVEGLEPNPTGSVYQCWYVGPDDGTAADGTETQDRISVGTFRTRDGSITIVWPTAADPKRYPKVGITLEPNDGNPLRSGPKVLVGATSAKVP